jgi:hypothetical protein
MSATSRWITTGLLVAAGLALAAPAHADSVPAADTVLVHEDWSCDIPYSGELECARPVTVPPGGYVWIGITDGGGPTVFTVYTGSGADRRQIGWGEQFGVGGAGRYYTNDTGAPVLADVTMHEDAPTDRCGTYPEKGFVEVRR